MDEPLILSLSSQYIRKRRPPKLTMEQALEEVLQEMRLYTGADTTLIQGAETLSTYLTK